MSARDPLAMMLAAAAAQPRFPPNSRHHTTKVALHRTDDGREIPCLARRIIPLPEEGGASAHTVREGDRLDLIAARALADAERWWAIADANPCRDPDTLTAAPGRALRLPGSGP